MQNFNAKVFEIVKKIPCGKVLTYGDIARMLGNVRFSRRVGWALHNNPEPIITPCHRVVFADGSLASSFAFGGADVQAGLLESEGVKIVDGKVDLSVYRWEI